MIWLYFCCLSILFGGKPASPVTPPFPSLPPPTTCPFSPPTAGPGWLLPIGWEGQARHRRTLKWPRNKRTTPPTLWQPLLDNAFYTSGPGLTLRPSFPTSYSCCPLPCTAQGEKHGLQSSKKWGLKAEGPDQPPNFRQIMLSLCLSVLSPVERGCPLPPFKGCCEDGGPWPRVLTGTLRLVVNSSGSGCNWCSKPEG